MEAKELRGFLKSLNDEDFRYLEIQMSIAKDARKIILEFKLTKERFCELMGISQRDYQSFLNGGYNFDVRTLAKLHTTYVLLKKEKAEMESADKLTSIAKPYNHGLEL